MEKYSILATIKVKPGFEREIIEFLQSALPLVNSEPDTVRWFAVQSGPSTFFIFDTFDTSEGRKAHLNGRVAEALMNIAPNWLAEAPVISLGDIIAQK